MYLAYFDENKFSQVAPFFLIGDKGVNKEVKFAHGSLVFKFDLILPVSTSSN